MNTLVSFIRNKSLNLKKMKSLGFLIVGCFTLLSVTTTFAQNNCNVELSVVKNRNIKTLKNLNYTYNLQLTNIGAEANEFIILANNANETCENPDGSPSTNNIILSNQVLDQDLNPVTDKVLVKAGETLLFYVKVTASPDAYFEKWNCTEVIAEPVNCSGEQLKVIIHTFNPDRVNQE